MEFQEAGVGEGGGVGVLAHLEKREQVLADDLCAGLKNHGSPFQTVHFNSCLVPLSIYIKRRALSDSPS